MFEENEDEEPIAFVVFRRTQTAAMRRWTAGGAEAMLERSWRSTLIVNSLALSAPMSGMAVVRMTGDGHWSHCH